MDEVDSMTIFKGEIVKAHLRNIAGVCALSVALCVVGATSAYAAGSGYGNSPPPSAAAGGFHKVVTSLTVGVAGGTLTGSAYGASAKIKIPRESLRRAGEVVVTAGPPQNIQPGKGMKVVADFSVVVLNPNNGVKLKGEFNPPMVVTIRDKNIVIGDHVVAVTSVGHSKPITAHVSNGVAVISFNVDPNFAVVKG
jgi:hypothetical protein